jgi:hypothetical protein
MKSFKEFILEKTQEPELQKVEVNQNMFAEGVEILNPDEVKKLLKQYDWFYMMIDDMSKYRAKMQSNNQIKANLKKLGVVKITLFNPGDERFPKVEVEV